MPGRSVAPPSEGRVFISYRRDDSTAYASAVRKRLSAEFGDGVPFRDVDDIGYGEDFEAKLATAIGQSAVMLVIIGDRWLSLMKRTPERDYVCVEVAAALRAKLQVTPVLVRGARMPLRNELPGDVAPLATLNAFRIDDADLEGDVDRLAYHVVKALRRSPAMAAKAGHPGRLALLTEAVEALRHKPYHFDLSIYDRDLGHHSPRQVRIWLTSEYDLVVGLVPPADGPPDAATRLQRRGFRAPAEPPKRRRRAPQPVAQYTWTVPRGLQDVVPSAKVADVVDWVFTELFGAPANYGVNCSLSSPQNMAGTLTWRSP